MDKGTQCAESGASVRKGCQGTAAVLAPGGLCPLGVTSLSAALSRRGPSCCRRVLHAGLGQTDCLQTRLERRCSSPGVAHRTEPACPISRDTVTGHAGFRD